MSAGAGSPGRARVQPGQVLADVCAVEQQAPGARVRHHVVGAGGDHCAAARVTVIVVVHAARQVT